MSHEFFKVNDAIPSFNVNHDTILKENKTILEIHNLPQTEEEQGLLTRTLIEKYHGSGHTGVTIISGENLADDPRIANRVNLHSLYVIEI